MPIPVNIVTGSLGVGKTTALRALITTRPKGERWAVLVNEFGALGIDGAMLHGAGGDTGGVTVREVAGGCMCCAGGMPLAVTIAQLLRQAKPHRLLVEPSGLGHPAGLVDAIRGEHLKTALDLRAIICLVDPRVVAAGDELLSHPGFVNQVAIADVLVASKADLATPVHLSAFDAWAQQLFPRKQHVHKATHGDIDVALLDIPFDDVHQPLLSMRPTNTFMVGVEERAASSEAAPRAPAAEAAEAETANGDGSAEPGRPVRKEMSVDATHTAAGWLFHVDDVFHRERLRSFLACALAQPDVQRCKGIFRTGKEWESVSWLPGADVTLTPVAYRHDSRMELIVLRRAAHVAHWDSLQSQLLECLKPV